MAHFDEQKQMGAEESGAGIEGMGILERRGGREEKDEDEDENKGKGGKHDRCDVGTLWNGSEVGGGCACRLGKMENGSGRGGAVWHLMYLVDRGAIVKYRVLASPVLWENSTSITRLAAPTWSYKKSYASFRPEAGEPAAGNAETVE